MTSFSTPVLACLPPETHACGPPSRSCTHVYVVSCGCCCFSSLFTQNSWGHFKSGVSAELLGEVADALVSLGLRDAGCESMLLIPFLGTCGALAPVCA
jgi:hypothetical protein